MNARIHAKWSGVEYSGVAICTIDMSGTWITFSGEGYEMMQSFKRFSSDHVEVAH